MNDDLISKRISETQYEIFPLDRLLPLEAVYSIFEKEYNKTTEKSIFFTDRKFQRLREGFFSLFVAMSLKKSSTKEHYMIFPSNPQNDLYIVYEDNLNSKPRPTFGAYEFDVKEFTEYSSSFESFFKETIKPKIDLYNILVPTYNNLNIEDIQCLITYLKENNSDKKVWILGSVTRDDQEWNCSGVSVISKDGIIKNEVINLHDWIDISKPIMVFQDTIRFK
jgi:hypothetical protein